MEMKVFTPKQKIERARKKVSTSLNVFRKAYGEVEVAIKDLETVVGENENNISKYEEKIRLEEENKNIAKEEIEANKTLLSKFSEFLPLTPNK